jgi:hypothetical protein
MDARIVNRALRGVVWPALRDHGFVDWSTRAVWRDLNGGGVDVVEVPSVGSEWVAVGCTSYSVSAHVASIPSFMRDVDGSAPTRGDRTRPHYWHCSLRATLSKRLAQPWFEPFRTVPGRMTEPQQLHYDGLKRVVRSDVHDRPDIWFVREDGGNLVEVLEDLTGVLVGDGLSALAAFHDPGSVTRMVHEGRLGCRPGSPAATAIARAARASSGPDTRMTS